jgi:hypothetical protein
MGGLLLLCKKTATLVLSVLLLVAFVRPIPASAIDGFDQARDFVNSLQADVPNIGHDIFFVLPTNSQQIDPGTWITLDFPNYMAVTSPSTIVGGFGTPTFSVAGTRVQITNMSLLPGTGLGIVGIFATNPHPNIGNQVILSVSDDQGVTQVRNQITLIPTYYGAFVNVSAVVQSPLSGLSISGYTSPNSFVTLTEESTVVGTTVSSGTGFFVFTLSGLPPGAHTYRVNSTDGGHLSTAQTTLSLFLLPNAVTTASGLLLSPTITLDKSEINPGDTLTISGTAKPNSQINLFVEAPLRSYTANTDNNGAWSYTLPHSETLQFSPGQYQAYTVVQDSIGNQSVVSPTSTFTVKAPNSTNPPPACNISHGDLNCNGITNLVDFSILLFHWHTNHKVADINGDGQVNLTDFSIMMFYFKR